VDLNQAGQANTLYADRSFRGRSKFVDGSLTTTHISKSPFSTSCDTRGQLEANSFMELKFGNKLHNLCVEWVVKNAMNRPFLADMEQSG